MTVSLKQLVSTQSEEIRSALLALLDKDLKAEALEAFMAVFMQVAEDYDKLKHQLALLQKFRFGKKSEKIDAAQLALFLAALETNPKAAESETQTIPTHLRRKSIPQRDKAPTIPDSIPREVIVLESPITTCACGTTLHQIGVETSQVLELVPSQFKVIVYQRPKLACRDCQDQVYTAAVPPKPIEGGLPGFGLMADVLIKKYCDHLPLHRIRAIYKRAGPDLAVSTLADWTTDGAEAFLPIVGLLESRARVSHVLAVDDTPITVLDKAHPGGSKRGYIYTYVSDDDIAVFRYTATHESIGPIEFIGHRQGWLQADGAGLFDPLFKLGRVTEVGCWSHCRRYFVEALDSDKRAAIAVEKIKALFEIERESAALDPEQRLAARLLKSKPVLEELQRWIDETRPFVPPKSPLGKAFTYQINQRQALSRFLEDGRLPIHNNACERALRRIAVGRSNWMFAGSDQGAERAATIYSVVATCQLRGVEPWAYIKQTLEKLASGWPQSRVGELLPKARSTD